MNTVERQERPADASIIVDLWFEDSCTELFISRLGTEMDADETARWLAEALVALSLPEPERPRLTLVEGGKV